MFKQIISDIDHIEWFPITVLIIFFIVFSFIIYRTYKMSKKETEEASNIPLNDNTENIRGNSNG